MRILHKLVSLSAIAAAIFLLGCTMDDSKPKSSTDTKELLQTVEISLPIKSSEWEIFGTPEYRGGVPGPTDFITLIAEITPTQPDWFESLPDEVGGEYIVPGAVRPWLTSTFQDFLKKNENAMLKLPVNGRCRVFKTRVTKSGAPIKGFICTGQQKALLYLTLTAYS